MCHVELVAIERQACQVAQRSKLAHEFRVDGQLAMTQVDGQNLIFAALEEMPHAVRKLVGLEDGVCDMQVLRTASGEAVEDEIDNLRCVDKVAAERQLSQVDAQSAYAPEARRRCFQGLEVLFVKEGNVTAREGLVHDNVPGGHVQVQCECTATAMHFLDHVFAHMRQPQQGSPVPLENIARQDEHNDLEEHGSHVRQFIGNVHIGAVRGRVCMFFDFQVFFSTCTNTCFFFNFYFFRILFLEILSGKT